VLIAEPTAEVPETVVAERSTSMYAPVSVTGIIAQARRPRGTGRSEHRLDNGLISRAVGLYSATKAIDAITHQIVPTSTTGGVRVNTVAPD